MDHNFVANYWENRYSRGGNSGAGSYGRCLDNKCSLLSQLLPELGIRSVVDMGCGDGTILEVFRGLERYTGYDISPTAISRLIAKGYPPHYSFKHIRESGEDSPDLALSMDVIFHLVGDADYDDYLRRLALLGSRHLLVLTWNSSILSTEHTTGDHVKYRDFPSTMKERMPEYYLAQEYPYELSTSTYYLYSKKA